VEVPLKEMFDSALLSVGLKLKVAFDSIVKSPEIFQSKSWSFVV
jgi:hypothetical protein